MTNRGWNHYITQLVPCSDHVDNPDSNMRIFSRIEPRIAGWRSRPKGTEIIEMALQLMYTP